MKKYSNLVIEIVKCNDLDVICDSGPLAAWEFNDTDFWNE